MKPEGRALKKKAIQSKVCSFSYLGYDVEKILYINVFCTIHVIDRAPNNGLYLLIVSYFSSATVGPYERIKPGREQSDLWLKFRLLLHLKE